MDGLTACLGRELPAFAVLLANSQAQKKPAHQAGFFIQVPKKRYALFRALMRALRRLFWRAILFLANTPLLTMLSIIG